MDPERLTQWQQIIRDFVILGLAIFVAVFGVTSIHDPTVLGITLGFAATLLGVPAALRLDQSRRKNGENGNGHSDRWSGLP